MSGEDEERTERDERSGLYLAAISFAVAMVGAFAFMVIYWGGEKGTPSRFIQFLGISLMLAFGGIAAGLTFWAHGLMPMKEVTEERKLVSERTRGDMAGAFEEGRRSIGRRPLLGRMFAWALGLTGLAAIFPLRSLGKNPFPGRSQGGWGAGVRLVRDDGKPVRVGDVEYGSIVTVFPQGKPREADSQTVLMRLPAALLQPLEGRETWSPEGYIAFSKVCTHAGCPVGLYQVESQRLFCPCHQSVFDVLNAAKPLFGPATRPLPQLPLAVDGQGFLVSQSDYLEPVGPGYWTFPR